jgi:hypothetical protein
VSTFCYIDFRKASLYDLGCYEFILILIFIVGNVVMMAVVIKIFFYIIDVASMMAALVGMAWLMTAWLVAIVALPTSGKIALLQVVLLKFCL